MTLSDASVVVQRGDRRLFTVVRGEGSSLLFAHGLSGTHADSRWLSEAAAGFRVISPDLYGRGRSAPAHDPDGHTFEQHADDVAAILDHFGVEDAVIGGTSFGAAVAVAFAVRYPARVRALLLLACAFGSADGMMDEGNLERYGTLADRMEVEGVRAVAESEAERSGSRRPIERWAPHDEASLIAFMRAVPRNRPFAQRADLGALIMPTLVVSGNDEIHRPALSAQYAGAIPGATLVGHSAPLGQAVATFLEPFVSRA